MRGIAVIASVAWQERDTPAADIRDGNRIGGFAVRRLDAVLLRRVEQAVEAGPADDTDVRYHTHGQTLTGSLVASYGASHGLDRSYGDHRLCRSEESRRVLERGTRVRAGRGPGWLPDLAAGRRIARWTDRESAGGP